jgi:hypothetical protein
MFPTTPRKRNITKLKIFHSAFLLTILRGKKKALDQDAVALAIN